jgi:hypothetical protein
MLACRSVTPLEGAKLGPGVRDLLERRGTADVMVALAPAADGVADARRRAEIARLQDAVLSALGNDDFRLRQRYEAVPALAGTVLSPRGLARLLAHAAVRRVDLDAGGGGSAVP